MHQNKKAQHKLASWASVITRYERKNIIMACESLQRAFLERGGIFLGE